MTVSASPFNEYPTAHGPGEGWQPRHYNQLITDLRAPTERAHALLSYWRALDRVTVCPQRIGTIVAAAAALVLTSMQRGRW